MLVHHAGGKHERPVNSRPLRFMNGRSIAMVDIAIAILAEHHIPAIVETDR
ncbi:hypothetical protein D9M72_627250 [compost metagenome]